MNDSPRPHFTDEILTGDRLAREIEALRLHEVLQRVVAEWLVHPEWVGDVALPREGE